MIIQNFSGQFIKNMHIYEKKLSKSYDEKETMKNNAIKHNLIHPPLLIVDNSQAAE